MNTHRVAPNPLVTVYIGPGRAIVAPNHATPDGILYEQATPIVLTSLSATELGAAVKQSFSMFSIRPKDLRTWKASDWPAFQASAYRTIKKFESDFLRVSVFYLNPSGAVARASTPIPGDTDYEIAISFNPALESEEIGLKLLGLVERLPTRQAKRTS